MERKRRKRIKRRVEKREKNCSKKRKNEKDA